MNRASPSRTGVALGAHREITSLMHSVRADVSSSDSVNETLARLRADSAGRICRAGSAPLYPMRVTPNDPLYSQQWVISCRRPMPRSPARPMRPMPGAPPKAAGTQLGDCRYRYRRAADTPGI